MAAAVGSYMFELAAAEVISWSTAAAVSTFVSTYGAYVVLAASMAYSASEARRMQAEAKDAAANATRDRTVTVTGAVVPRELVLGRARTGGANFYHAVTGTDSNTLYVTIALAGHPIYAVDQIYVNDEPVTLDADGFVTTAPYSLPTTAFGTVEADANGIAVLDSRYAGTVLASKVTGYTDDRRGYRQVTTGQAVTVTGTGTTLDPYIAHTTPGATVSYNYTDTTTGSLRFAVHLGGDDQVVDPWLHAEFAEWLSSYVVKGVAYLVARMVYDTNAFPSSVPSISALVRGALVDDPRGTTPAVPGDVYFDDVSLLIHGNGLNNSTNIVDSSIITKTIANYGVKISTGHYVFDTSSLYFDGSSSLEIGKSDDFEFNSNDFTIQCQVYFNNLNQNQQIISYGDASSSTGSDYSFGVMLYENEIVAYLYSGSTQYLLLSVDAIYQNQFLSIKFLRSSNTLYLYCNSALQDSISCNVAINNLSNSVLRIGKNTNSEPRFLNGYLDEIRITKGVARAEESAQVSRWLKNIYIPASVPTYLKASRTDGVFALQVGNDVVASQAVDIDLSFDATAPYTLGAMVQGGAASDYLAGYIDEHRATKGNPRPGGAQTAPWPNSTSQEIVLPNSSPWVGTVGLFSGRVGPSGSNRYDAQLTVNSDIELLNVMVPRNVYQPGCNNTLFDAACGLAKSAFAASATASGATDATLTTFATSTTLAASYYAQGWAVGATGANAGVARTIKANGANSLQTIRPWAAPVAAGDTFTLYPGCDKKQATCSAKFANLARFRGQPYVPAPETVT